MTRAPRWSALTPSLPFSGPKEATPRRASPLFGAIHEAFKKLQHEARRGHVLAVVRGTIGPDGRSEGRRG